MFTEMLKMWLENIKLPRQVLKPDIIWIKVGCDSIYDNHVIVSCNEVVQRFLIGMD